MDNESNNLALRISKFKNESTSGKYKYPVSIKSDVVTYANNNRHKKIPDLSEDIDITGISLIGSLNRSIYSDSESNIKIQ